MENGLKNHNINKMNDKKSRLSLFGKFCHVCAQKYTQLKCIKKDEFIFCLKKQSFTHLTKN